MSVAIPIVDLFAGPGGLGEGFSSVETKRGEKAFNLVLSIEKDRFACETLRLRSFFREFERGKVPSTYYDFLRTRIPLQSLYDKHPTKADIAFTKVWNVELGGKDFTNDDVRQRSADAIEGREDWVLIGGPPCQAYSIAGRSRNRGNSLYDPREDVRQHLYLEYLQVISDHWPAVFVMENVKGLLSATLDNQRIFQRIVEDLSDPKVAISREKRPFSRKRTHTYRIHSFVRPSLFHVGDLRDTLIRAENHGIPQARHRVILLGIRDDLGNLKPRTLTTQPRVSVSKVLNGMPPLRSGMTRGEDSPDLWIKCLRGGLKKIGYLSGLDSKGDSKLKGQLYKVMRGIVPPVHGRGGEFLEASGSPPEYSPSWYLDQRLDGICNHSSRAHMTEDLHRYLYAACFAKVHGHSPNLKDFPVELLPNHGNVQFAIEEDGNFSDRFRVQVSDRPASTITSHIAKDGHYYIHPDPFQCRSLTVREAARIQTFPDNYFFLGPRTSQYTQIGNAVPPLLARQMGEIVLDLINQAGL
jgi:DNA (cytosine-5)-methyltransferase 1